MSTENWINAKEKLPNHGEIVICQYEGVYGPRRVRFWRDGVNDHFGDINEMDGKGSQPATHWIGLDDWIKQARALVVKG